MMADQSPVRPFFADFLSPPARIGLGDSTSTSWLFAPARLRWGEAPDRAGLLPARERRGDCRALFGDAPRRGDAELFGELFMPVAAQDFRCVAALCWQKKTMVGGGNIIYVFPHDCHATFLVVSQREHRGAQALARPRHRVGRARLPLRLSQLPPDLLVGVVPRGGSGPGGRLSYRPGTARAQQ